MSRHSSEPPAGWLPSAQEETARYPTVPGSGYSPAPEAPAIAHDEYGGDHQDTAPGEYGQDHHGLAPGEYGVVYDGYGEVPEAATANLRAIRPHAEPAGPEPAGPGPAAAPRSGNSAARMAMLAYLTVPLLGFAVPLVVYLRARRGPGWTRAHAAQALNVWITVALYELSAMIMGTMLALDSPQIAMIVFGPLIVGLWLVALVLLVRAATAASQGEQYTFPGWLCSRIVR